ncbi:hypothetical protein LCGC14_2835130 [marine sediment metagenome]|uniref:Uncharacterized protein n=1 Tax=marine sediment metagenome TaxID=412755 RepID=A0A0F9B3X6_9ZZZZ
MHEWKLYDDGSGAFCVAHHGRACMMDRDDVELRLNVIESLRQVARAASRTCQTGELAEALDALPSWLLEER